MNNDSIKLEGILEQGYGLSPKKVMKDKSLTIEAKAIYAYMSSYAGQGTSAFPSVSLMCSDLGISELRLRKHRDMLIKEGYVTVERLPGEHGKFGKNLYTIKQVIEKPHQQITMMVSSKDGKRQDGELPGRQNVSANNNSSFNNNSNTNNNSNNKRLLADEVKSNSVNEIIKHYKTLPNLPNFRTVTDKRKGNIKSRLSEFSLEEIKETLSKINETKFFIDNKEKSWFTFDWIFNPDNFVKIIEGKYWDDKNNDYNVNKGEKVLTAEEQALKDLLNF